MARHTSCLGGLCAVLVLAGAAHAQVTGLFSTERTFTATAGPHAGMDVSHGDLLSTRGTIANTNFSLIEAFCKKPIARDVGLDALHVMPNGQILFSVEDSFFAECRGNTISHGDLLSPDGTVVRTNAQLMANFHPKPPTPDMGLDAVHVLPSGEVLFSIEDDIFDEQLGVVLTNGDILSERGRVVRTNSNLIANFHPQPGFGNFGVDVIVARPLGEFWWSPEKGWFDEILGVNIGDGDLLSTTGHIVATEAQLLTAFLGAEHEPGIGLDAFSPGAQFGACGTLQPGPACPVFVPDDSKQAYFLENLDGHAPGDRVFVAGDLNLKSNLCVTIPGPGIENNSIGQCFEGCGFLVRGAECTLFQPHSGGLYSLSNYGAFEVGDEVFVRGQLFEVCFSTCQEGGCIEHNDISACCPCDWNAHDGINSQDYFDFLSDFFNGDADFNNDTFTNSQDYFDFLRCFFNGCR